MNARIEQLTRTYLDGLPYFWRLDNEKKRRIIEINGQTEWIIFNAGSLKSRELNYYNSYRNNFLGENGKYSSETYDIISPTLSSIFKEVIKIYGSDDLDRNNIEIKLFQFVGGDGNFERAGQVVKKHAIPLAIQGGGKGNDNCWVAVNKKVSGEDFEAIFMDGDLCFNHDRRHWKVERNLDDLLSSNDIISSRERVVDASSVGGNSRSTPNTPPPPNNFFPGTQTNIPTPNSASQFVNVSFTIDKVSRLFGDIGYFILEPANSFSLLGNQIVRVYIDGNPDDLQVGNAITINNVQLQRGRASIDNGNELFVASYYDSIQVDSRSSNSSSVPPRRPQNTPQSPSNTPPPPPPPPLLTKMSNKKTMT